MTAIAPLVAIVLGVVIALSLQWNGLPDGWGQYVAIAALAGLDSLVGGLRGVTEGKFVKNVFLTGFLSNAAVAVSLSWLGERMLADLYLAVVVVLGGRIFNNLTLIRRKIVQDVQDRKERAKLREAIAAIPEAGG